MAAQPGHAVVVQVTRNPGKAAGQVGQVVVEIIRAVAVETVKGVGGDEARVLVVIGRGRRVAAGGRLVGRPGSVEPGTALAPVQYLGLPVGGGPDGPRDHQDVHFVGGRVVFHRIFGAADAADHAPGL